MNRGILAKAIRELLPITLLLGALLLLVEMVLAYVLPTFARQFQMQMMRVEFFRNIIKAMLGTDMAEGIGTEMFSAIAWVHPVVLALVWAHAIICCTRVPAGEVDRGTIDVLLGLPVSRWNLYVTESVVWIASALVLLVCAVIGNSIGARLVEGPAFHAPAARIFIVLVNMLCLYVTVGAAAWFFSALSDRRGRAMGVVFVIVIASFLLNYLAQFWEPAQSLAAFGMLRYYRPLFMLRDGNGPTHDMTILMSVAGILWITGGIIFARRDLSTL